MVESIVLVVLFYYIALGVPQLAYSFKGWGYERFPIQWIIFLSGILALFVQSFPNSVWLLLPEDTYVFLFTSYIFLFVIGLFARLELVGRHPQHRLFLKNRMEFMRFSGKYLLVKAPEILVQQIAFGVLALLFIEAFSDSYFAILYLALFVGLLHIPAFLFVNVWSSAFMIGMSALIAFMVGLSVLLGYGITISIVFHWLIYLGAVPFAWRMCERDTCPFA